MATEKKPEAKPAPLLLTRHAAAELIGINVKQFDRHVRRLLPIVMIGRTPHFDPRDIQAWIDEQRQGAPEREPTAPKLREAMGLPPMQRKPPHKPSRPALPEREIPDWLRVKRRDKT